MLTILGTAFSWLTGNSKSADNAMAAVDKMVFTDEEKSEVNEAARTKVLDFKIRYAEATQNQSVARRILAVMVAALWTLLGLTVVIAGYFDRADDSFAAFVATFMTENVTTPMTWVLGFYFGAHIVGKLTK